MSAVSNIHSILRFAVAVLVAFAAACTTEPAVDGPDAPTTKVTLRLSTGSSVTRGDEHYGDDPYGEQSETRQEEKIDRVDLFFFSSEQSDEAAFFTYEAKNVNDITTSELSVKIPIELTEHFTDNNAYVYALVNLPSEITVSESANTIGSRPATLENLTTVWVQASGFVSKDIPSSFVMRGGSEVTITGDGKNAEVYGIIKIERLASKIRLWADIPQTLYFDADGKTLYQFEGESLTDWEARRDRDAVETWDSVTTDQNSGESNVRLYLYNLTTRGRIDAFLGSENDRPDLGYDNIDRRDEVQDAVRRLSEGVELAEPADSRYEQYIYTHSAPYYSYPNEWDSTTPSEEHQTYVIIEVPWRRRDNGAGEIYQRCYYQVPVNALKTDGADADRLDPNRYYRIRIRLGMLGSKDLGSPTRVDASYEVVDWVTADVDVSIKDRRYLVVNQKDWTMNNVSTVEIPFSTSHEVEIEYCYVNYFRYHDAWGYDRESISDGSDTETATRHRSEEFQKWYDAAYAKGYTVSGGEGVITADFDSKTNDSLYYKDKYFRDEVKNSYIYYVGKEQPKTFQRTKIFRDSGEDYYTDKQSKAWTKFEDRYGMSKIYSCDIDNQKSVIRFTHPLVQWEEIRDEGNTGSIVGYAPLTNPRTGNLYDEYSRCEIIIRLKHKEWKADDDLYRETIYITQYPGMYIEVSHNYGNIHEPPASLKNRTEAEIREQQYFNQYVVVNGNNISKGSYITGGTSIDTEWYEPNKTEVSCFYGSNNNPNMYVIHTTQLAEDNEFLYDLGDPRTMYYNNLLTTQSFTDYKGKNTTRTNGTPDRWSDADIVGEASLFSNGSAWWTSRKATRNNGGGGGPGGSSSNYTYSEYELVESLYADMKPDNTATTPPASSNNWNNYVNHKNNLCYYYPADESTGAGSTANVVAPVFRIASSFGKVSSTTSIEPARRRCAVYQEAGRPAGRWRLPTKAEIQYIARLSAESKIPILLGNALTPSDGGHYWSANGKVIVNNETGTVTDGADDDGGSYSPRCVYDEWYWTKIDAENGFTLNPLDETFRWGDLPKDNTQVQPKIQALINPQAIVANE